MHPLLDKYIFTWRVWDDFSKHLTFSDRADNNKYFSVESRFYIEKKYSIKDCIHFSIECSVIATLLNSVLGVISENAVLGWQPQFDLSGTGAFELGPLQIEVYLLLYFFCMVILGSILHRLFDSISSVDNSDPLSLCRFLTLYPGLVLCTYFVALFVDVFISGIIWILQSPLFLVQHGSWVVKILGLLRLLWYLTVLYTVVFAPLVFFQLLKFNYGSRVKYIVLGLVALVIVVSYILYEYKIYSSF